MTTVAPERVEYDINGITLVGDLWPGAPGAEPVVLAHGGGQTRHSWGRTAARLAGTYTVLNYDARGHGNSDWDPAGDYSLDAFAGDLLGLMAKLDRPPVLVGASLGGSASLVVAGEHPGRVRALVLVDVVVEVEPAGVSRIREFLRAHAEEGFASLDDVVAAVASYNPLRRRPVDLGGMRKNVRQRSDGRWYWHWDPVFLSESDSAHRITRAVRLREAASRIAIPTLIVRGGRSDVVSAAGVANMLELIPGAETVAVEAAGHMVAGDDNDVFAEDLLGFLSRLPPSGS